MQNEMSVMLCSSLLKCLDSGQEKSFILMVQRCSTNLWARLVLVSLIYSWFHLLQERQNTAPTVMHEEGWVIKTDFLRACDFNGCINNLAVKKKKKARTVAGKSDGFYIFIRDELISILHVPSIATLLGTPFYERIRPPVHLEQPWGTVACISQGVGDIPLGFRFMLTRVHNIIASDLLAASSCCESLNGSRRYKMGTFLLLGYTWLVALQ